MIKPSLAITIATVLGLGATTAFADHNSATGEGWANMPNDIHNTRIETLQEKDNEAFREFVKYGDGAESVNRFDSDDTTAKREKAQAGKSEMTQTQSKSMAGTRKNAQVQEQRRIRPDAANRSTRRERAAAQRSSTIPGDRERRRGQRSAGSRGGN